MALQTRRAAVASLAGLSAMAMLDAPAATREAARTTSPRKLGIQLYMLGDEVGANLEGTLSHVAAIGYQEVELPHFYNREPIILAKALAAAGLACPSIHVPLEPLWPEMPTLRDLGPIADAATVLGATNIVVPLFPSPLRLARALRDGESGPDLVTDIASNMTISDWRDIARRLNETAASLTRRGLRLAYHNHNVEFLKLPDGRTPFDLLLSETEPALVDLELDVGWVAAAGLEPATMVERHASRIRQVHLKDLAPTPVNTALRMNPADLGQGIIDWKTLLPVLQRAGIEHLYVEQEPPFERSRLDSARHAFEFLRKAVPGPSPDLVDRRAANARASGA